MADTTDQRLERIEDKLDQLTDAMISLARAEEKIAALAEHQTNQTERLNRLSIKIDDIEKKVDENAHTVGIINKLVFAALVAAVGAIVAQWI